MCFINYAFQKTFYTNEHDVHDTIWNKFSKNYTVFSPSLTVIIKTVLMTENELFIQYSRIETTHFGQFIQNKRFFIAR